MFQHARFQTFSVVLVNVFVVVLLGVGAGLAILGTLSYFVQTRCTISKTNDFDPMGGGDTDGLPLLAILAS